MEKTTKFIIGLSTILVITLITFFSSIKTIPTGFVGVKSRFGAVQDTMINEGFNFKAPFIEKITTIDCRIQKSEVESQGATKDLQTVTLTIAVNYNVRKDTANKLFKEIGKDFKSIIVDPAILESIKGATALYTAEELITRRSEVSQQMTSILNEKIQEKGFQIIDFNIINLDFSPEYNIAIEQKQVIEQQTKSAQYQLQKAKVDNEKKIIEAEANAKVMELQKLQITNETLELKRLEIQSKALDKWNGVLPNYMLDNTMPFINLNN